MDFRKTIPFLALLALVGCAEEAGPTGASRTPQPAEEKTGSKDPSADRLQFPDFTLKTLDGKPWTLSEQKGKVTVVNYWATWCPPCREETPDLVKVSNAMKDDVTFLGVSLDYGKPGVVKDFVKTYKIGYQIVIPEESDPLASNIGGVPTTYLLDRNGRIAEKLVGAIPGEVLQMKLKALVEEKA